MLGMRASMHEVAAHSAIARNELTVSGAKCRYSLRAALLELACRRC
jgi:hypothetical protein